MWSHQGRAEEWENLPCSDGHILLHAPQETIGPLGHQDTLLSHGELLVHQHSKGLLSEAAFQQLSLQHVLVQGKYSVPCEPIIVQPSCMMRKAENSAEL